MEKHRSLTQRHRSLSSSLYRRLPRSPALRLLLLLFLLYDSLHTISLYRAQTAALSAPPPPANYKRIYIAAQHWNNARLLRQHWNNALVALVQELGVDNVYVSVYESGSYDDTKAALGELDQALDGLRVQRRIVMEHMSHADEIAQMPSGQGWIQTPKGETRLRRIPFLAAVRNHVFEPLEELTARGETFDSILFLNDVVFSRTDVLRLLDTNGGDYTAACSMDYSKPPSFYDTFALRDSGGHEAVMGTWPWFRAYKSRYAAERFLPVPVASCWNGMVAMPITPFLATPPLRFRGIPDSLASTHVEASECCLIHADNPYSPQKGVFLNPNVKVGYNGSSYNAVNSPDAVMSPIGVYVSIWKSRILRWISTPVWNDWVVSSRMSKWAKKTKGAEGGAFCLVDEMQILYERGWKHV